MFLPMLQAMREELQHGGASPELLARVRQFKSDLLKLTAVDTAAHLKSTAREALETLEQIEMLLQLGLVLEASKLIDEMIDSA